MGGGAVMRSAVKVAGIGVGIRGARIPATAEHPVVQMAGHAIRPAVMTATEELSQGDAPAATQNPAWELDDWEFAGFEEAEPPARVVFGPSPTLEEAKSAASELKDALGNFCLAPNAQTGLVSPFGVPSLALLSGLDSSETKDCVTCNPREAASLTPSAVQAFKLFNESSSAQSVVASVAADPDVWNAVLRNPALQEYFQTQKTTMNTEIEESVEDVKSHELSDGESVSGKPEKKGNGFMHLFEDIKATVVDMADIAFSYLQNTFGFSSAENASPASDDSTKAADPGNTRAAYFMGLAIMVIMLVVLRRP